MASPIRYKVGTTKLSKYVNKEWVEKQTNNTYIASRQGNLGFVITLNERNKFKKAYSEGSIKHNMSKALNLPVTITKSEHWNSWSDNYDKYHFGAIFSSNMIEQVDERIKDGIEFEFRQYLPSSDRFVKWKVKFTPTCEVKEIIKKAVLVRL